MATVDGRRADSGEVTLRWSNAGHPAPVLVCADGSTVRGPHPDRLLGVSPVSSATTTR